MEKEKFNSMIYTSGYGEELHFGGVHTIAVRIAEELAKKGKVTVITQGKRDEILHGRIIVRNYREFDDMEKDFVSLVEKNKYDFVYFTDFRKAKFLADSEGPLKKLRKDNSRMVGDFSTLNLEIESLFENKVYKPNKKFEGHYLPPSYELYAVPGILKKEVFDLIHVPTKESIEIIKKYFDTGSQKWIISPWGMPKDQIMLRTGRSSEKEYRVAISLRDEKVKRFYLAERFIENLNKKSGKKFVLNVYGIKKPDTDYVRYHGEMSSKEVLSHLSGNDFIISTSAFETFSLSIVEGISQGLIPIISKDNIQQRRLFNKIAMGLNLDEVISLIRRDPDLKRKSDSFHYSREHLDLGKNLEGLIK